MKRLIQDEIKKPLSELILFGESKGEKFVIDVDDGKILIKTQASKKNLDIAFVAS